MEDKGFERKLTAILSADVEGYSRLMDDDEKATISTPTSYLIAMSDLNPISLYFFQQESSSYQNKKVND